MTERRDPRDWAPRAVLAFVAITGAASSLAQFVPGLQAWSSTIILGGALAAAGYAWQLSKRSALPVEEVLPLTGMLARLPQLTIEMTALEAAPLQQVHHIASDVYPGVAPIPIDRYRAMLERNSTIFVCLLDRHRRVLGYFDVMPLDPSFLQAFCEGLVREGDLRAEHIMSREQAVEGGDLYLAGIAVLDHNSLAGRRFAAVLVWGLVTYLKDMYPPRMPRRLFAEAATKEGETLLLNFGFRLVAERGRHRGAFRMYAKDLTRTTLDELEASIPDFSRTVAVHWPRVSEKRRVPRIPTSKTQSAP